MVLLVRKIKIVRKDAKMDVYQFPYVTVLTYECNICDNSSQTSFSKFGFEIVQRGCSSNKMSHKVHKKTMDNGFKVDIKITIIWIK
uniref:Uncharacterized protein n=1 Tax=Arion vulgaris TaxID=1028688 RepID=A0A0B7B1F9_9EUPU